MSSKKIHKEYLKSVIFGFQDSLVSTTGVIAGVAAGTNNKEIVILAGVVTIAVESLSMGAGQYLSQKAAHQMEKDEIHTDSLFVGGGLMVLSYFLGGLVPLIPVVLFRLPISATLSITFALIGLFILGYLKARVVKVNPLHSAIEILVIGGSAALIGVIVGRVFKF
jgi:vacuolar iron transporter family protein